MSNNIVITLTSDKILKLAKTAPEKKTTEERITFVLSRGLANLAAKKAAGKTVHFFGKQV